MAQNDKSAVKKSNSRIVTMLVGMVFFMSGFSFALVPLYDVFCEITGLNGKTADGPVAITTQQVDKDRTVRVQFIANLNNGAPWEFRPDVFEMAVHPGQLNETVFYAQNLTSKGKVAQAIPSVAPGQAASYFHKTECFCFNEQAFKPGEERDMPLRFMVDPELPDHIKTLTLSYTFFELDKVASN
jgi:cytochrome c oxidase assembly protein subunit 11